MNLTKIYENKISPYSIEKMNQIQIISKFMTTAVEGLNGTTRFPKPYNKWRNYQYTKLFEMYNLQLLKEGMTNIYLPDEQKIFNRNTMKLENRNLYYKKKKLKPNAPTYLDYVGQTVGTKPSLMNSGYRFNYLDDFQGIILNGDIHKKIKQILLMYAGKRILVINELNIPQEGVDWRKERTIDVPINSQTTTGNTRSFSKWYDEEGIFRYWEVSSGESIFGYNLNFYNSGEGNPDEFIGVENQGRSVIFILNDVPAKAYEQAFAEGVSHCILNPIKEYLYDSFKGDLTSKKENHRKQIRYYKKILKWEKEYPPSVGIPISVLPELCEEVSIGIDLYLPCPGKKQNAWKQIRPGKKARKIFKFINSRFNHLEVFASFAHSNKITLDGDWEYDQIKEELKGKYHIYNDTNIITEDAHYSVSDSYITASQEFQQENNLDRYCLDYNNIKNRNINDFILASCVYNGCVDFVNTDKYRPPQEYSHLDDVDYKSQDAINQKILRVKEHQQQVRSICLADKLRLIDMSKAYTRCNLSPFFDGYLAKVSDFRKTTKIQGVGLYQITNIDFTKCSCREHIQRLKSLFDYNVYPSPELKFLRSLGVSFDIVCGCWGQTIDINWGQEKNDKNEYIGMYEKGYNGLRHYCRWFGVACKPKEFSTWKYNTKDERFLENWNSQIVEQDESSRMTYCESNGEFSLNFNVPKKHAFHHAHICSFIYSYQRIMMIQQLIEIPIENVVRVVVDGIYFKDADIKIHKPFEVEDKFKFGNVGGDTYRTANLIPDTSNIGEPREYNKTEIHIGPGGCGKTHSVMTDKGNVNVVYVAHSWKLASAKRKEFNCDVSVIKRLEMEDWFSGGKCMNYWEGIFKKYSVIVVDEISTLHNFKRGIIENRFTHHKICWCGDIGPNGICYQAPPINVGFRAEPGEGWKRLPFMILDTDKVIEHTRTWRIDDCPDGQRLRRLLNLLREMIYDMKVHKRRVNLQNWIKENLIVESKEHIKDYTCDDMILSRLHYTNEYYDKKYKDIEKYYSKEAYTTYKDNEKITYYKGTIYSGKKPNIPENYFRIRHGYTIDCIQGETAYYKLIIDVNELYEPSRLYTAISRAKRFSQIQFVE